MFGKILAIGLLASAAPLAASAQVATFGNNGKLWTISTSKTTPTRIQAENFDRGRNGVAYFDTTVKNLGKIYRADSPDLERAQDSNGRFSISRIVGGERVQFSVNVKRTGTYNLALRVARKNGIGQGRFEFLTGRLARLGTAGGSYKTLTGVTGFNPTGGSNNYKTIVRKVRLKAGKQTLRFVAKNSNFKLNWFSLKLR